MPGETPAPSDDFFYFIPTVPASAGAMIFDRRHRLLVLKPTYKKGWTIPGGMIERGESPWDACRREVEEEAGLTVSDGRMACVDFLRQRPDRPGGLRFLFDCGVLGDSELSRIELQAEEISEFRLVKVPVALELLSGPLRRRVGAASARSAVLYLEDGRPVDGVRNASRSAASRFDDGPRKSDGRNKGAIEA